MKLKIGKRVFMCYRSFEFPDLYDNKETMYKDGFKSIKIASGYFSLEYRKYNDIRHYMVEDNQPQSDNLKILIAILKLWADDCAMLCYPPVNFNYVKIQNKDNSYKYVYFITAHKDWAYKQRMDELYNDEYNADNELSTENIEKYFPPYTFNGKPKRCHSISL